MLITLNQRIFFCYNKANYEAMRERLQGRDLLADCDGTVEGARKCIKDELTVLRDELVPTAMVGGAPKWKQSRADFPISNDVKCAMRERDKAHRSWMKNKFSTDEPQHRKAYTRLRNTVKYLTRRAKADFEDDLAKDAKENPKRIHAYTRKKLKTKSGIAPLNRRC